MSDYGIAGSKGGRNQLKSPPAHQLDDSKSFKKKYEHARDALKEERKLREQL